MKYSLPFLIVLVGLLFACSKENNSISRELASNSVTQVKQATIVPVDFLIFNDCTNEWAHFSGEFEAKLHAMQNQDNILKEDHIALALCDF